MQDRDQDHLAVGHLSYGRIEIILVATSKEDLVLHNVNETVEDLVLHNVHETVDDLFLHTVGGRKITLRHGGGRISPCQLVIVVQDKVDIAISMGWPVGTNS